VKRQIEAHGVLEVDCRQLIVGVGREIHFLKFRLQLLQVSLVNVARSWPTALQNQRQMLRRSLPDEIPVDFAVDIAKDGPDNDHSNQEGVFVFLWNRVLIPIPPVLPGMHCWRLASIHSKLNLQNLPSCSSSTVSSVVVW